MGLSRWMVFEPKDAAGPSEAARFVRDRFSVWAFLMPWAWLLRYGLWLAGLLALVASLAFAVLEAGWPAARLPAAVIPVLIGILVALEGPSLRAAKLRRKGWRDAAVVEAASLAEAEIRYYAGVAGTPTETGAPAPRRLLPWNFTGDFAGAREPRGPSGHRFTDAMRAR